MSVNRRTHDFLRVRHQTLEEGIIWDPPGPAEFKRPDMSPVHRKISWPSDVK